MTALVLLAQRSRAPIQKQVDVVSRRFVLAVLVVAALTFVGWSVLGPDPRFAHGVVNAVAVLIIACPCALGLATPMSVMVATGCGAGAGVLFRDAEAIETLRRVDTLILDKTGTLTEGRPVADDRGRGDELQLGLGHRELVALARRRALTVPPPARRRSGADFGYRGGEESAAR